MEMMESIYISQIEQKTDWLGLQAVTTLYNADKNQLKSVHDYLEIFDKIRERVILDTENLADLACENDGFTVEELGDVCDNFWTLFPEGSMRMKKSL